MIPLLINNQTFKTEWVSRHLRIHFIILRVIPLHSFMQIVFLNISYKMLTNDFEHLFKIIKWDRKQ
jgi:hypothetical protein